MRRLSRLDRSVDRFRPRLTASSSSSFLCSACCRQAPFSTSIRWFADPDKISHTEKLRRRLWGTDEPPGLEDPYGGPSIIEERRAARDAEEPLPKEKEAVVEPESQPLRTSAPPIDPSYEPAKTWEGLEEVGELPAPEFYFEGFIPTEAVTDPYEATAALHRAVVEVFTLRQAGRPFSELSSASKGIDKTSNVQISAPQSSHSRPVITFPANVSEETVVESLSQQKRAVAVEAKDDLVESESSFEPSVMGSTTTKEPLAEDSLEATESMQIPQYQHQVASWDLSWLQVSLEDPEIKFAVVKRVMQLTGIHIPDTAINSSNTVNLLLTHLTRKPKPAKLFDALADVQDLVNLPNVKIFNRRITPIDREKRVGRWKIIEKELNSRGLPLMGHQ